MQCCQPHHINRVAQESGQFRASELNYPCWKEPVLWACPISNRMKILTWEWPYVVIFQWLEHEDTQRIMYRKSHHQIPKTICNTLMLDDGYFQFLPGTGSSVIIRTAGVVTTANINWTLTCRLYTKLHTVSHLILTIPLAWSCWRLKEV